MVESESRSTSRTWVRALLLGWLGWSVYAALYAAILSLQAGVFFPYALAGSLVSHYLMGLYSIPIWVLTTRVLAGWPWPLQLLAHVFGGLAYAVAWHRSFVELFRLAFGAQVWQQSQLSSIKYWLIHEAFIVYSAFVGIFYVRRYQQQLLAKERQEADLRLHAKQMELAVLKGQLNPHFLFNTLNSINALVRSNPEGARQVLAQLAEVLRYSLESDRKPMVALADELHFLSTYLEIEKARYGRRLRVRMEIEDPARPLLVPPMILQPLMENAVKHGIAPKEEGGEVTLRIRHVLGIIEFEVADNGVGAPHGQMPEWLQSGTGLYNTDQRLRKMFGDEAGLQIGNGAAGFQVKFRIPAVCASDQSPVISAQ
jgi:signal transduction histidine kinase